MANTWDDFTPKMQAEFDSFMKSQNSDQYAGNDKTKRNNLGQFYTPPELTAQMYDMFFDHDENGNRQVRPGSGYNSVEELQANEPLFDPTGGSGNLLAGGIAAGHNPKNIWYNELDPKVREIASKRLTGLGVPESHIWPNKYIVEHAKDLGFDDYVEAEQYPEPEMPEGLKGEAKRNWLKQEKENKKAWVKAHPGPNYGNTIGNILAPGYLNMIMFASETGHLPNRELVDYFRKNPTDNNYKELAKRFNTKPAEDAVEQVIENTPAEVTKEAAEVVDSPEIVEELNQIGDEDARNNEIENTAVEKFSDDIENFLKYNPSFDTDENREVLRKHPDFINDIKKSVENKQNEEIAQSRNKRSKVLDTQLADLTSKLSNFDDEKLEELKAETGLEGNTAQEIIDNIDLKPTERPAAELNRYADWEFDDVGNTGYNKLKATLGLLSGYGIVNDKGRWLRNYTDDVSLDDEDLDDFYDKFFIYRESEDDEDIEPINYFDVLRAIYDLENASDYTKNMAAMLDQKKAQQLEQKGMSLQIALQNAMHLTPVIEDIVTDDVNAALYKMLAERRWPDLTNVPQATMNDTYNEGKRQIALYSLYGLLDDFNVKPEDVDYYMNKYSNWVEGDDGEMYNKAFIEEPKVEEPFNLSDEDFLKKVMLEGDDEITTENEVDNIDLHVENESDDEETKAWKEKALAEAEELENSIPEDRELTIDEANAVLDKAFELMTPHKSYEMDNTPDIDQIESQDAYVLNPDENHYEVPDVINYDPDNFYEMILAAEPGELEEIKSRVPALFDPNDSNVIDVAYRIVDDEGIPEDDPKKQKARALIKLSGVGYDDGSPLGFNKPEFHTNLIRGMDYNPAGIDNSEKAITSGPSGTKTNVSGGHGGASVPNVSVPKSEVKNPTTSAGRLAGGGITFNNPAKTNDAITAGSNGGGLTTTTDKQINTVWEKSGGTLHENLNKLPGGFVNNQAFKTGLAPKGQTMMHKGDLIGGKLQQMLENDMKNWPSKNNSGDRYSPLTVLQTSGRFMIQQGRKRTLIENADEKTKQMLIEKIQHPNT